MKTQLLVNIGLDIGQRKNALSLVEALEALVGWTRGTVVAYATHASGTENTLVARLAIADLARLRLFLAAVADECEQDAIACFYETGADAGTGFLVGPRAEAWGPFNPEFFLILDGRTLAEENRRDSALLAELGA